MSEKIYVYPKKENGIYVAIKECGGVTVIRLFTSKPSQEFLDQDSTLMATDNVKTTTLENVAIDYFDELETN